MGRTYKMTFEPGRKRWAKMFKGQRFLITCEELGAQPTLEGSYHLANQWWDAKLAELLRPQIQEQELLNRISAEELERLIEQGQAAQQLKQAKGIIRREKTLANKNEIIISVVREDGNTNLRGLASIASKASGKPVEAGRTIGRQVQRFLALEMARGKKPLTYQSLDYHLSKMMACPSLNKETDIDNITAQSVSDFYTWLRNSGMSEHSQWKCFCSLKSLVRFLWGESLMELPRNLASRQFSFNHGARVIKNYPTSEVRELLVQLPERLKLYAYLALNCGMLAVDIGNLKHDELQGNRVIRKRTKTRQHDSVPIVNYLLWDETLALLNKYRSNHPELVLTTERGTPLWESRNRDGKTTLLNYVKVQWGRRKLPIPFKALRSIGANLLKEGGYDLQMQQVYLCHAPSTIAERHYVNYSQQKLDEAITWLRSNFFPA